MKRTEELVLNAKIYSPTEGVTINAYAPEDEQNVYVLVTSANGETEAIQIQILEFDYEVSYLGIVQGETFDKKYISNDLVLTDGFFKERILSEQSQFIFSKPNSALENRRRYVMKLSSRDGELIVNTLTLNNNENGVLDYVQLFDPQGKPVKSYIEYLGRGSRHRGILSRISVIAGF